MKLSDWFAFNGSIISKHLTGKRKAIAIDPSYIPKSGKKTPWIGYFWLVVQESTSVVLESWASVSLTSTTMNA